MFYHRYFCVFGMLSMSIVICTAQTPPIIPKVVEKQNPVPVKLNAHVHVVPRLPSGPITLKEAVSFALANQPQIENDAALVDAARGRANQAASGLYPSLSVGGTYTPQVTFAGSSSSTTNVTTGLQVTLTLKQLLFDSSHTLSLLHEESSLQKAAFYTLEAQKNDTAYLVSQAFDNAILAKQTEQVQEENIANREQQLALSQARLKSGIGLPSDMVNAETALAQGQVLLSTAQANSRSALVTLALQMGLDPRIKLNIASANEPVPVISTVDDFTTQALQSRPDIQADKAIVMADKNALSVARTNNDPTLNGDVEVLGRGNSLPPGTGDLLAGVSVTYSPYDGGYTAGLIQQAKADIASGNAQLLSLQQQVVSDTSTAYVNLESAQERVSLSNAEVVNAQQSVNIADGRYKEGLGLFQDILTAQAALVSARLDQVNSELSVQLAIAQLRFALGEY